MSAHRPAKKRSVGDAPLPLDLRRFLRNVLLAVFPVIVVWVLITPFLNRFLLTSGQNLCHLFESPNVSQLLLQGRGDALVVRSDFPPARSTVYGFRVTDVHFHLVLLGILFLAVPAVPWRRRLENLGWAVLVTLFFDIALVFFWVKFAYATQLGDWSLHHYSHAAREIFGLAKQTLDLPFKLGLPLLLWAAFYLPMLAAGTARRATERGERQHHI